MTGRPKRGLRWRCRRWRSRRAPAPEVRRWLGRARCRSPASRRGWLWIGSACRAWASGCCASAPRRVGGRTRGTWQTRWRRSGGIRSCRSRARFSVLVAGPWLAPATLNLPSLNRHGPGGSNHELADLPAAISGRRRLNLHAAARERSCRAARNHVLFFRRHARDRPVA
jgi:hypothetical protein